MLTRLKTLARLRTSFAFETTLASRSFAPWLTELKGTGYLIVYEPTSVPLTSSRFSTAREILSTS